MDSATPAAKQRPAPGADIDIGGSVTLSNASLDVGVPLKDVEATITLKDLAVRDGRPASAEGNIAASSLSMAGRVLRDAAQTQPGARHPRLS